MTANKNDNEKLSSPNEGHPFFNMKSTLTNFIDNKDWTGVEGTSRNMIHHYPEMDFGWFALGLALSRLEDFNDAIINFKKAIYLNPNNASSYYQLGITFFRKGNYNDAVESYDNAINKGMRTHYVYYNLGNAWFKLKNNAMAIKYYLKCLSICPDYTPAAYCLFHIYFSNEDYNNAVTSLKPVIKDSNLPGYLLAQARLLYENENDTSYPKLRKAHKLLNSAIELDDKFALAYYERAYIKTRLGDTDGYAKDKAMAFSLDPKLKAGHSISAYSQYFI